MRASWIRVSPKSNDKYPCKTAQEKTDTRGEGRVNTGRDGSDASVSQGMLRIGRRPPKLGEGHGKDFSAELPEGINSADALILDFRSPEP